MNKNDITGKREDEIMYQIQSNKDLNNTFTESVSSNNFLTFKDKIDESYVYDTIQLDYVQKVFNQSVDFTNNKSNPYTNVN
jgi:hypothetical protein